MLTTIQIGSFSVRSYVFMIGVGALGMLVCILSRKDRFRLNTLQCTAFTLLLTVCGVAGAMLLYYLESGMKKWGGTSFFGSVFLIPIIMPLIGKLFRLKVSDTLDLCGPCIAIMVGFIRIGCWMNDCCGGWVMYVGDSYFAWPTQLMECVGDFAISVWLLRIEANEKWQGALCPLFMLSYSIMRFFLEFLRYVPDKWLNLGHGQWFAIAAIIISVVWIQIHRKHTNTI